MALETPPFPLTSHLHPPPSPQFTGWLISFGHMKIYQLVESLLEIKNWLIDPIASISRQRMEPWADNFMGSYWKMCTCACMCAVMLMRLCEYVSPSPCVFSSVTMFISVYICEELVFVHESGRPAGVSQCVGVSGGKDMRLSSQHNGKLLKLSLKLTKHFLRLECTFLGVRDSCCLSPSGI